MKKFASESEHHLIQAEIAMAIERIYATWWEQPEDARAAILEGTGGMVPTLRCDSRPLIGPTRVQLIWVASLSDESIQGATRGLPGNQSQ